MDFLAILFGVVGGTILFSVLHKQFNIYHYGFKGIVGMWTGCFFAALITISIIVSLLGGVLGFLGTIIAFLFKIALIGGVVYGLYSGYKAIRGTKQDTTESE